MNHFGLKKASSWTQVSSVRAKRPFPLGPPSCGDECRAERALGCGRIFPCGQQAGATVRKRRREGNARAAQGTTRVESRYTIQTCDPSVSRTAVRWAHNSSSSAPAQIPRSFLRSFSLWARHPAETSAELNVRLGAAEFFPGASRQVRRVRKRRREGNARAAQGTASGRESGTRYKPAIRR